MEVVSDEKKYAIAERILSSLSNLDSIRIFVEAKDGIKSSTKTIKKLGLSQKRYYTRLNELIKAGLIQKNGETYELTTLGALCYKMGERFIEVLTKHERIELLDKLRLSNTLSTEEAENISRILAKDIVDAFDIVDLLKFVRVANTWEEVVQITVRYIENAKKSIYMATQYIEMRVVETILRVSSRKDLEMYFLSEGKDNFLKRTRMILAMFAHPKMLKQFYKFFKSSDVNFRLMEDIPYSLLVVDDEYAFIEITNPYSKTFAVAFAFHDKEFAKKIKDIFFTLWNKAEKAEEVISKALEEEKPLKIKGK